MTSCLKLCYVYNPLFCFAPGLSIRLTSSGLMEPPVHLIEVTANSLISNVRFLLSSQLKVARAKAQ